MRLHRKFLMTRFWIDFIFPNVCPICRSVINWNSLICEKCESKLPFISEGRQCTICGEIHDENESCHRECSFERCVSIMEYDGKAKNGVYNLKHNYTMNFAEYSSLFLARRLNNLELAGKIDMVTFVPMSRRKEAKRGYNQAEEIAGYLAKHLHKPLTKNLIVHKLTLNEQHKLDKTEREKSAEKTYVQRKNHVDINGKTVLLCDDVITTGATLEKCSKVLLAMGAKSVMCATICTTKQKVNT